MMEMKNRLNANLDNHLFYLQEHPPFVFEGNIVCDVRSRLDFALQLKLYIRMNTCL